MLGSVIFQKEAVVKGGCQVEKDVSCRASGLSCSSVTWLPCSIESAPASIAVWMLVVSAA